MSTCDKCKKALKDCEVCLRAENEALKAAVKRLKAVVSTVGEWVAARKGAGYHGSADKMQTAYESYAATRQGGEE